MRQIDQMTDQERDTLRLKGMLPEKQPAAQAQHSPLPWRLEVKNGTATIYDARGWVTPIVDMELGWTDTSTGNYHDPDTDASFYQFIIKAVNAYPHAQRLAEALKELAQLCDNDGALIRPTIQQVELAREALAEWSAQ
jgi:hypothetical protein